MRHPLRFRKHTHAVIERLLLLQRRISPRHTYGFRSTYHGWDTTRDSMILKYVHAHTKRLSSSLHIGRSWNYMCPSEAACSLDCICVGSGHMRVACNGGCPNYRTDAAHVLRSTHLTKERRFAHGASRPLRCRRSCRCRDDAAMKPR